MKAAVIVFPGSNCDRDMATAFRNAGLDVQMVWHKDTALPSGVDIVGVPGGSLSGITCAAAPSPPMRPSSVPSRRMRTVAVLSLASVTASRS